MDYEKKYNEALDKAKKYLAQDDADIEPGERKIILALFPELRESEDERIRKKLIQLVNKETGWQQEFPSQGQCLDWLEKHKEPQKHAPSDLQKSFEAGQRSIVDEPEKYGLCKPAEWNDADMREARNNLISVCRDWERGEKTTLLPVVAVRARYFLEHLIEPQKQEWSEEDEKKIHFLSRLIEFQVKDGEYCFGDGSCTISKQEAIEMLKSLRPQPQETPIDTTETELFKMGYEEARSKFAILFMHYLDDHRPEGKMCLSNGECADIDKAFQEVDFAKLIRYANKYGWKPSEEQIVYLGLARGANYLSAKAQDSLNSLYCDLLKLK